MMLVWFFIIPVMEKKELFVMRIKLKNSMIFFLNLRDIQRFIILEGRDFFYGKIFQKWILVINRCWKKKIEYFFNFFPDTVKEKCWITLMKKVLNRNCSKMSPTVEILESVMLAGDLRRAVINLHFATQ